MCVWASASVVFARFFYIHIWECVCVCVCVCVSVCVCVCASARPLRSPGDITVEKAWYSHVLDHARTAHHASAHISRQSHAFTVRALITVHDVQEML
jgi:hypothetical protein